MEPFFKVVNKDNCPTIYIDGIIGVDCNYADFRTAFATIIDSGCKRMKMKINSAGGDMVVGFAIYDMLVSSGLVIDVEVVGMAASMAGIIAQAASPGRLGIHSNASWMTHKPQSGVKGESDVMRSMADFTDQLEVKAIAIYKNRTNASADEMKDWFKPGSMKWFTAQEAIAAKLADYIIEVGAMVTNVNKPKAFANVSDAILFYNSIIPAEQDKTENKTKSPNMKKVLMVLSSFNIEHNLKDESTEDQVSEVVKNALTAKDLKITELQAKLDVQNAANATALVENAIKDGKIKADSKDKYVTMATANYDTVKDLFEGIAGRIDPKAVIIELPGKGAEATKAKTFNQHTEAELRALKSKDLAAFNALFKAEYGEDLEEVK